MGFHAFRRFRKTWLRGKRVQEDINNFWMGMHRRRCRRLILVWIWNSTFVSQKRVNGVGFTIRPFNCSKLLQNFGRIGCRIGFASLVESGE